MSERATRLERLAPPIILALAAYVPLLLTAPGRVGADSEAFLYLDPDRLLGRAWSMWDPSSGLGGLSHQTIGYLWPMGPWFWVSEHIGLPDWVAQRLWLATILFAAGAGTLWLLRSVLGWRTPAATVAAFSYAFTPYVLSLAARLSVILLPFAGLPILLGLTIRAVRRGGWRDPAAFALVVATVGSVNATALLLVGLGPLWWLVVARARGEASTSRIMAAVARIGVLTVAVNLWWLSGLWAQGSYGIAILQYTETAETANAASNAVELLRGLGYWFFYGSDRLGPWIEPSVDYTQRLPLLLLTFALPTASFLAAGLVRFRDRGLAVGLVAIGLIAAVGAYPFSDPAPLGVAVRALLETDAGLAMRSLPRAVPLIALGLALCLGAGAEALASALTRRPRTRRLSPAVAVVTALFVYAALPPLWTGAMVASNLDRPEDLPSYWLDAVDYLDSTGEGTRVLEIPGAEFASYRWGNTVDAITPGLMDRPQAARELIPYGSPPSADLLAALDIRIQEGTLEPGALAAVARLLGAGDVLLRNDLQFERYRGPRPYVIAPWLAAEPGLAAPVDFGDPVVNEPVPSAPLDDELGLSAGDDVPRPPLQVFALDDPVPIVHTHPAEGGIVLAGDGTGIVYAAEAGLVAGNELLRYGASLSESELQESIDGGAMLVITDTNRQQGRRWKTVRDVFGLVEPPPVLVDDSADNRLPLFPEAGDEWQTTAAAGDVAVAATSYGNPNTFTPEYRPANVADGDVATEWRTGTDANVVGERIELTVDGGSQATELRFVQQISGARNRHITEIEVRIDGGPAQRVLLDERSLRSEGQVVALDRADGEAFEHLSIEVRADSSGRQSKWGRPARFVGLTTVGFAEVELLGDEPSPRTEHALGLPPAATDAIGDDGEVALVLSRWRTDPTNAVRQDPETAIARSWNQPVDRTFTLEGTARLTPDAVDPLIDQTLGVGGPVVSSSTRLIGVPAARASAALDGDTATAWSPSFLDPEPSITVVAPSPTTIDSIRPVLVDDGLRSIGTRLRIEADSGTLEVDLPPSGTEIPLPVPLTGTSFRFTLVGISERTSIDWFSQSSTVIPPAIAELGIPELEVAVAPQFDTGCREDLLQLDGAPIPVRIVGATADALARQSFEVSLCGPELTVDAGNHVLRAANGLSTGIDLDQLVLRSSPAAAAPATPVPTAPRVEVVDDGTWQLGLRVEGAVPGEPFWLVLGQSYNLGWELDGEQPQLVDGFANGWLVDPAESSFDLRLAWVPQRVVILALQASAVAVAGCLAILVVAAARARSRRRAGASDPDPAFDSPASGSRLRWSGGTIVAAVGVGSVLAIGPVAAVVVVAAGAATLRWRWAGRVLVFAPAAAYALTSGYVLVRQVVSSPAPAFEWPAEQAAAHQPAMTAIALLILAVALRPGAGAPADSSARPAR